MTSLIVDDETLVAQNLEILLRRYCPEVNVIGMADSAQSAEVFIKAKQPDLVFLDVEMPNGNGFDLLKKFDKINFGVIFVTAFDHYAIRAIKFSAIDYLLKPIDIEQLIDSVHRAEEHLKTKASNQEMSMLLHNISQPNIRTQKLSLPSTDGILFVNIDDILYCKSDGNYTTFYQANGQQIVVTRQIGTYEDLLPEPIFCRIHRQYIINVNKVSKYIKGRGGYVIMSDGKIIDVSARKKDDFLSAYKIS